MRCIALVGQLLAVMLAQLWLGIGLPLAPVFGIALFLAAFNGWTWRRMHSAQPASDAELFVQLFIDVIALSALLYFSGGATNPFVSFYLPVLAVAAAILPWRYSLVLAVLSLLCYSMLTSAYMPLHVGDPDRAVSYHLAGMWANFALSAGLITWFVARMSGTLRERDAQLSQAREQRLRSERMVALGVQAANAAHEMGTPLSIVAVIAGELRRETEHNAPLAAYREDMVTIEAQIALCKAALEHMSMQANIDTAATAAPAVLSEWLMQFAVQWRLRYPATRLDLSVSANHAKIDATRAIGQIVLTLLDNAAQAVAQTDSPVSLMLSVGPQTAEIIIADSGQGIHPEWRERLGYEPVKSTSGGQGLGLMLAFAIARQCGARIALAERQPHGTVATLTVPLA